MSRAKAIRQSQIQKPLKHVKDEYVIRLLNSWVIQNERLADFDTLPPNKQKARRFFEDQMRIAMCIAKNKPEITSKPHKPEKPYRGFYEFVHKMRTAATDRSYKYFFPKKLHNGSPVVMIDGTYHVHNLDVSDEKGGSLDLIKDDLVYHVEWNCNPPKFYYLPNMDMGIHQMKEGLNSNSQELDQLRSSITQIKSAINTMSSMGIDTTELTKQLEEAEKKVKEKEGR